VFVFPLRDEADEFVEIGALNGIFVLGRSMGFIGELGVRGS
jgi:ATP citrate (pro-S)-lyase